MLHLVVSAISIAPSPSPMPPPASPPHLPLECGKKEMTSPTVDEVVPNSYRLPSYENTQLFTTCFTIYGTYYYYESEGLAHDNSAHMIFSFNNDKAELFHGIDLSNGISEYEVQHFLGIGFEGAYRRVFFVFLDS